MRASICLNMIVKNEQHVIERCLNSAKPFIDHWVIVDTGSGDGTQDIIRSVMSDIPGTLYERPWKNFGHNRTEAITLADGTADYILTIDADETLTAESGFSWGPLTADSYLVEKRRAPRVYRVLNLVKSGLGWQWQGVLHEFLDSPNRRTTENVDGIAIFSPREGARAQDPLTYRRDALLLEQALLDDPDDMRNVFYLAQSYRDARDFELAIRHYRRRVDMGGWSEEVYISHLNIARILDWIGDPFETVVSSLLDAHNALPSRVEALYDLGMQYSKRKDWPAAWLFLEKAAMLKHDPRDILFLEEDIYLWRAKMEAAVAAYWCDEHEKAIEMNTELLSEGHLPDGWRENVEKNLRYSREALG